MDWAKAIDTHQTALTRIVATLIAMLGLARSDSALARLPKPLYRAVLRVLRPAEAAVRRLIVVAAHGLVVKLYPPQPARLVPEGLKRSNKNGRRPSFPLFDPAQRAGSTRPRRAASKVRAEPRIHFFDGYALVSSSPPQPAKLDDGSVSATRLARRLQAIKGALDDLPGQAKRLARWRARQAKMPSPKLKLPQRPGPPPGYRQKPQQEIDWLLWECHLLAIDRLNPDTS